MNGRNTLDRYGALAIFLHWFMVLLIAAVYACMELSGSFPKGSDMREGLKTWHYMLGLCVLVLVICRLVVRFTKHVPHITPSPSKWQRIFASAMHVALYVLMVVLPMLGWLILSAKGSIVPFFGLELPHLISESKSNAGWIKEIHETGAAIGYFLIGLHAAAGLFHHYFVKDNTLRRMLPQRKEMMRDVV